MKIEPSKRLISYSNDELAAAQRSLNQYADIVAKEIERRRNQNMVAVWGFRAYNPESGQTQIYGFESYEKARAEILKQAKNPGEAESLPYQIFKWYATAAELRKPEPPIDPR